MKNGENGMVDLSPTGQQGSMPKPVRRKHLSVWLWVIVVLIAFAIRLWFW
jgi:hypothetical protein